MTSNDFGRACEARFVMDAQAQGFQVLRPFAEAAGYDVVLDNGKKLFRVQVKGARPYRPRARSGNRGAPYHQFGFKKCRSFEVFAGWMDGESTWVFLPKRECRSRALFISSTNPTRRRCSGWEIFR